MVARVAWGKRGVDGQHVTLLGMQDNTLYDIEITVCNDNMCSYGNLAFGVYIVQKTVVNSEPKPSICFWAALKVD